MEGPIKVYTFSGLRVCNVATDTIEKPLRG